jgi:hypothetical protein
LLLFIEEHGAVPRERPLEPLVLGRAAPPSFGPQMIAGRSGDVRS